MANRNNVDPETIIAISALCVIVMIGFYLLIFAVVLTLLMGFLKAAHIGFKLGRLGWSASAHYGNRKKLLIISFAVLVASCVIVPFIMRESEVLRTAFNFWFSPLVDWVNTKSWRQPIKFAVLDSAAMVWIYILPCILATLPFVFQGYKAVNNHDTATKKALNQSKPQPQPLETDNKGFDYDPLRFTSAPVGTSPEPSSTPPPQSPSRDLVRKKPPVKTASLEEIFLDPQYPDDPVIVPQELLDARDAKNGDGSALESDDALLNLALDPRTPEGERQAAMRALAKRKPPAPHTHKR